MSSGIPQDAQAQRTLCRAKDILKGVIKDLEAFKTCTDRQHELNRKIPRKYQEFWEEEASEQMTTFLQMQASIIERYEVIDEYIGEGFPGCESLKEAADIAYENAQDSQKEYDKYCNERADFD